MSFIILFAITWKEKKKPIQYAVCLNILDTAAREVGGLVDRSLNLKLRDTFEMLSEYCNIKEEECQI